MQESNVAKTLGIALHGGPLEGLQIRLGFHHFYMVLPLNLVQHCQSDRALEGPGELAVKLTLHSVHEKRDVVGTARSAGGLEMQSEAEFVPRPARVERWAVEDYGLTSLLVAQVK